MSRMSRAGRIAALFATVCLLLAPASTALADGPVAHKSGAIVNYVPIGKLKVAKKIFINFTCSVTCNLNSTSTIKGLGGRLTIPASGTLPAGSLFLQLTVKGVLLKLMKAQPGAFKIVNTINASDPATGATDTISRTFKLKR